MDRKRFIEVPLKAWSDIDGTSLTWRALFTALMDLLGVWRHYRGRR